MLEWSPDASVLAVGAGGTHSLVLYDARLRELRTIDLGDGGTTWDLSFSPDGRLLAAGRDGRPCPVIDTTTWRAGPRAGKGARGTGAGRRVASRQQHGGDRRQGRAGLPLRRGP